MKKMLFGLGLVMVGLVSVVVFKTLGFTSRQVEVEPVEPAPVDGQKVAEELSGALQFQTVSYEDRSRADGEEFLKLHRYLEETFPLVHEVAGREVINEYSLLYTWTGTDASLQPAAMMAHLDVVPVEPGTEVSWTYSAYSGAIEEGYVWGRGAMDNKASLIGILHAVEKLMAEGYQPRRTLFLAFGHDEEVGGDEGAQKIVERLAADDIELDFVIDEGGAIVDGSMVGLSRPVAAVSIAEKGYANLELTVETSGGHSSVPPAQTAVGILGASIARLEQNPMPGGLREPVSEMLAYVGPEMPFGRKMVFANLWLFRGLVEHFFAETPITNALIRTTTAATIFEAGVKANVLPSKARAVVNFRILPGDTVESVIEHVRTAIDDDRVTIQALEAARNPSPVSRLDSASWNVIQRTIRELYPDAVVMPSLLVGGSDSKHFTALTENVYRFAGIRADMNDMRRAHGTDERMSVKNLEQLVQFYIQLIRNSNEGDAAEPT